MGITATARHLLAAAGWAGVRLAWPGLAPAIADLRARLTCAVRDEAERAPDLDHWHGSLFLHIDADGKLWADRMVPVGLSATTRSPHRLTLPPDLFARVLRTLPLTRWQAWLVVRRCANTHWWHGAPRYSAHDRLAAARRRLAIGLP